MQTTSAPDDRFTDPDGRLCDVRPGLSDETIRRIEQAIANGRITVQIALALGRLRIEVIGQTPDIRTR